MLKLEPLSLLQALSLSSGIEPPQYLDGKTNRVVGDVTKDFKYQPIRNDCFPTCLHNVLHEMAKQHNFFEITFSLKKTHKICLYRWPAGPNFKGIPNLNKELRPHGYRAYERTSQTYPKLVSVLEDPECSYPIIDLPFRYLVEEVKAFRWDEDVKGLPDHDVIVLACDSDKMVFFDPYGGISKNMQKQNEGLGRGIVVIKTESALEYWEDAYDVCCLIWKRKS